MSASTAKAINVADVVLAVSPVAEGVDVKADQQILATILGNWVRNPFKFSRDHGHIALRTTATAARVMVEVEVDDERGGRPAGRAEGVYLSASQTGDDRRAPGFGFALRRKGVEALGGTLDVRNVPGKECVFTIALPRISVPRDSSARRQQGAVFTG